MASSVSFAQRRFVVVGMLFGSRHPQFDDSWVKRIVWLENTLMTHMPRTASLEYRCDDFHKRLEHLDKSMDRMIQRNRLDDSESPIDLEPSAPVMPEPPTLTGPDGPTGWAPEPSPERLLAYTEATSN